jgi:hypothetical protein
LIYQVLRRWRQMRHQLIGRLIVHKNTYLKNAYLKNFYQSILLDIIQLQIDKFYQL